MLEVTASWEGLDESIAELKTLEKWLQNKVWTHTLRPAFKPVLPIIKAATPRKTGAAAKLWKLKAGKRTRKGKSVVITTNASENLYQGKGFYLAFRVFGTKFMAPDTRLQEAFNRAKSVTQARFEKLLDENIKKAKAGIFKRNKSNKKPK